MQSIRNEKPRSVVLPPTPLQRSLLKRLVQQVKQQLPLLQIANTRVYSRRAAENRIDELISLLGGCGILRV
jgi:hypothetical protein